MVDFAGAVIAKKLVQRGKRLGKIAFAAAINDVDSLAGVGVKKS